MDHWKVTLSTNFDVKPDIAEKIRRVFKGAFGIDAAFAEALREKSSDGTGATVIITEHQFLCFFILRRDLLGGQRIAWRDHQKIDAPVLYANFTQMSGRASTIAPCCD